MKDYIKIEYRGGSNLYILATQLDALQKYSGSSENAKTPKLNKLGGQEWNKTKSRVKGAVKKYRKRAGRALCSPPGERGVCLRTGYRMAEGI